MSTDGAGLSDEVHVAVSRSPDVEADEDQDGDAHEAAEGGEACPDTSR